MALIGMCVVANCSQRLSRAILWIVTACATYWTHSTAACVFIASLNPPSASQPPSSLVAQNPAVLAS